MNCGKGASDRRKGRDSGWSKRLEQRMAHHNCTTTNNLFLTTSGEEFAVYIMVFLQCFSCLLILLSLALRFLRIPISKCVVRLCNSYPLAPPLVTCSRPYLVTNLRGLLHIFRTLLLSKEHDVPQQASTETSQVGPTIAHPLGT